MRRCPLSCSVKCDYGEMLRVARELYGCDIDTPTSPSYRMSTVQFTYSMCQGSGLSSEGWHYSKCKKFKNVVKPEEWSRYGVCRHCGSELTGMFSKKCKDCGRPK
jgi:hypothetical protein